MPGCCAPSPRVPDAEDGAPEPLGVTLLAGGANVAMPAPDATAIELCVFADDGETRWRLPVRSGDIHHGFIPGLGAGARYGLRAYGPRDFSRGHRFNPNKLLLDPWARALDAPLALHPSLFDTGEAPDEADSAPHLARCVAEPPLAPIARPRRTGPEVIYELHVRGFTMRHPDVPPAIRGTFAGLAHPAPIAYLKRLGVTLVELMPCAAWISERHLPPLGLTNYWGYNPVAWLAPDPRLAPGGMAEVRAAVAALQAEGIGVILDIVLNHTGEGDHLGPTLSWRGLANAAFYRLREADARAYADDAGCGNTPALDRPWPLRLAMDALRHWAGQAGLDGFRLDLATTLGRRADGFDAHAPLLAAMRQDPQLRDLLMIAEPWDIGPGGYRLGGFAPGWGEWNDRFRDDVRRFWRGDAGMLGRLATRLAGSADLFAPPRRVADSLNYVTAHDGFTLSDLVAFTQRRNDANGEQGRDGAAESFSWNSGAEGPSEDQKIIARRKADVRALLAMLLAARGTPMLAMGDELGRTQQGNNNAYCQDSPLTWLDWEGADAGLAAFTARLVAARRAHPALHAPHGLTGTAAAGAALPDITWRRPDDAPMAEPDWHAGRALVADLFAEDDRVIVAVNGGEAPQPLALPAPRWGFSWQCLADSADPARTALPDALAPRSVLLLAEAALPPPRRAAPDGALLGRLAQAAGIATTWTDVQGVAHAVPPETVRALLDALSLPCATEAQARESLAMLGPGVRDDGATAPCFLPENLAAGARRYGISAQTYALRRAGDQGIGDFSALAGLARAASAHGAALVGISPPHALMPADRTRASPYQPSDRRFLEPVLLDVAALPHVGDAAEVRAALDGQASAFKDLSARRHIDYPKVWQAKRAVLEAAFRAFGPTHPAWGAFLQFRAATPGLDGFARFTALAELFGHTEAARWNHGDPPEERVVFHAFLQFLCEAQLAAAGRAGAPLYRDLAVGAAPDGAEVWAQPGNFLRGFSVGAPPDPLGPLGQVWGLPPPNPLAPGFVASMAKLFAANMRHAAALRIDHVMGLARLFVVPEGAPGAAGCYLRYPQAALLRALAEASHAARCLVVGEDLGTLPYGFAGVMQAARMLSYRVLWFERDGDAFRDPAHWPELATACVSTHDLPTLAGWWEGADILERQALRLIDAEEAAAQQGARARDRATFGEGDFSPALAARVHAHVAGTPALLMLAQAEDFCAEREAVNLPGTDHERPNWRRRLAVPVENLFAGETARAILAALAGRGATSPR